MLAPLGDHESPNLPRQARKGSDEHLDSPNRVLPKTLVSRYPRESGIILSCFEI